MRWPPCNKVVQKDKAVASLISGHNPCHRCEALVAAVVNARDSPNERYEYILYRNSQKEECRARRLDTPV